MLRNWQEHYLYLSRLMIGISLFVILSLANLNALGQIPQSTATPPAQSVTTLPQQPQPSRGQYGQRRYEDSDEVRQRARRRDPDYFWGDRFN